MSSASSIPKLIFAGLDSAGKTTIYKYTVADLNIEESVDSKATRGIDRNIHSFLDMDISVWDLGGQKSYREMYLSKPEIFNITKAVIFVVDIQDHERIQEAYEYFMDIMNILINVNPKPKVYVLFHKFDPAEVGKLRKYFFQASRLFKQADKLAGIKFTGFATSIYSSNIQKAVKRILWENMDNYDPNATPTRPPEKAPGQVESAGSVGIPKINKPQPTITTPNAPKISRGEGIPKISRPESTVPKVGGSASAIPTIKKGDPGTPKIKTGEESKLKSFREDVDKSFTSNLEAEMDELLSKIDKTVEEAEKRKSSTDSPPERASPSPTTFPRVASKTEVTPPVSTPKITSPVVTPPPVKGKEEEGDEEITIYEEVPDLSDLSTHVVDKLSEKVSKRMAETEEIIAIAVMGLDGKTPLTVAKNEVEKEKIEIVRMVVSQLNPKQFFQDIGDIEYRGLGHLQVADLEIYFARLTDEYAISIIVNDISGPMLENAQRIVTMLRQGLGMMSSEDEGEEEGDDGSDLLSDLRSRLSRIGSLNSLDD